MGFIEYIHDYRIHAKIAGGCEAEDDMLTSSFLVLDAGVTTWGLTDGWYL